MNTNIPDKYRLRIKDDDKIVTWDLQGWPQWRQNVRDIIISIGASYNEKSNKWEISDDNPILNCDVHLYSDDGMGYGTNEHFITSINSDIRDDNSYCNMFMEEEEPDLSLWKKAKFFPRADVYDTRNKKSKSNSFFIRGIKEDENGISYNCKSFNSEFEKWINEQYLEWN